MNIGFINQNISPRVNMGLAYVMTAVAQKHRVFFWDAGRHRNFESFLLAEIARVQPAAIGFSVNSFTFASARHWAQLIKTRFPKIPLIFGGVHPTLLPQQCLADPAVDMVCIGEGEFALCEALECLQRGQPPAGVPGIWYKTPDRTPVKNPCRPFLEDIDQLPEPDWDIWDIEFYLLNGGLVRNSLNVLASRGCYHDCRFCTAPVQRQRVPGQFYRTRSPQRILAEVKKNFARYAQAGFRYLVFSDPLFGADAEQYAALLSLYEQEGLTRRLPWLCETRPEIVTPDWARQAARAGCLAVSLGIESADETIRNRVLGKHVSDAAIAAALENLRRAGLPSILYLMLCAPEETLRSVMKTIRFAQAQDAIKVYFLFYLPLPETPLYAQTNGATIIHDDARHDDGLWNRPNIRPAGFRRGDYLRLHLALTVTKARLFLRNGWRLRRWRFVRDILTYLCGGKWRLSLSNPYALNELYQITVLHYFLDDHQHRMAARGGDYERSVCQS